MILNTYLNSFYNKYYHVQDGKTVLTNRESFDLPEKNTKTIDTFEADAKYINNKLGNISVNPDRELTLIILPDGTCYNALNDHMTCAKWLNVNGIDIDKAIRFETSKEFYDFTFCSLYNFDFSEKSDSNQFIELTNAQAMILMDIYKSLSCTWKFLTPLENCLRRCTGFGFSPNDYNPELCKKNLYSLSDYAQGFFDDYSYMKMLREKCTKQEQSQR